MTEQRQFRPGQSVLRIEADLGSLPPIRDATGYLDALRTTYIACAQLRIGAGRSQEPDRFPDWVEREYAGLLRHEPSLVAIRMSSPLVVEILESLPVQISAGAAAFHSVVRTIIDWQKHQADMRQPNRPSDLDGLAIVEQATLDNPELDGAAPELVGALKRQVVKLARYTITTIERR